MIRDRRHRALLVGSFLVLTVLALHGVAMAQKKGRIGLLGITPMDTDNFEMLRRGLGQMGYVEGPQLVILDHNADGAPARLPERAAELGRAGVDVIVARGAGALAAAAQATRTIPIVAVDLESDPIASGYARALARPGGNVTGVFLDLPELSAKQLQLFREITPNLGRVGVLGDPVGNAPQFAAAERAARHFGIRSQSFEARVVADVEPAIEAARRNGMSAVLVLSSPVVFVHRTQIAAVARERRLPTISLFTEFAEAGGLLSYGPSLRECFRRSGVYVAKVLSGEKPADLPIERPEKFDLVINLKTAKALGLTVPPALLLRADRVIE
jgi:putative ABC transport system substrate-binding protein